MKTSLFKIFNDNPPTTIQDFQEVAIALYSRNLALNILTEEILKQKKVIPSDWQLSKNQQFINKPFLIQLPFENGFKIIAQPGKINFSTRINEKKIPIDKIINNFIYAFPQINYQTLQITPRRLISLPGKLDVAEKFIKENLILPGDWQNFKNIKPKVQINFYYELNQLPLILKINDVKLNLPQKKTKPALLFSGIFSVQLNLRSKYFKLQNLDKFITNYTQYINDFNKIVNSFFQ